MATRFCTACGAQLGEGVSFCTACGAPAAAPPAAEPDVPPPPEMAQPSPEMPPEPIAEAQPEEPSGEALPEELIAGLPPEALIAEAPPEQPAEPAPAPRQPVPLGLRGRAAAPAAQDTTYVEAEPSSAKSPPWAIIIGSGLALCVLIAVALAFSGELGREFGGSSSSSNISSSSAFPSAPDNSTFSSEAAPRPMTMPSNAQYFFGTWGPNCPQSRADAISFYQDGTFLAPGGSGTWTIDTGSTITMTGNGLTVVSRWSFSSPDIAVAYGMGPAEGQLVRRCS